MTTTTRGTSSLVALLLVPLLLAAALAASARAHDMWLVPPRADVEVGREVALDVAVGMDFPRGTHAIDPARIAARYARGPDDASAVVDVVREGDAEGRTRARFVPVSAGTWVAAVETLPSHIELSAASFNAYLLEDGIPRVLGHRIADDELDHPARERYRKSVKAIVAAGAPGGRTATTPLGLVLEIVPTRDPGTVRAGEVLEVVVLFEGRPLEDAFLCWDHPGNGDDVTGHAWTDADGRAAVPIFRDGLQTLRLVHKTRPRTEAHEWESFWASLTFVVPE